MNWKSIANGLGILNVAALIVTAVAAGILRRNSVPELFDIASYVALGMGALGALTYVGATSGSDGSVELSASAAARPSRMMDALWLDRNSGISVGAMLVLGGLSWAGIAWLLSELLS